MDPQALVLTVPTFGKVPFELFVGQQDVGNRFIASTWESKRGI